MSLLSSTKSRRHRLEDETRALWKSSKSINQRSEYDWDEAGGSEFNYFSGNHLPATSPFVSDLIDDRMWFTEFSRATAGGVVTNGEQFLSRALLGYQRFLYLLAKYPQGMEHHDFSPNPAVDLIWHTYLAQPAAYRRDVKRLLGHVVHHKLLPPDQRTEVTYAAGQSSEVGIWQREFGGENPGVYLTAASPTDAPLSPLFIRYDLPAPLMPPVLPPYVVAAPSAAPPSAPETTTASAPGAVRSLLSRVGIGKKAGGSNTVTATRSTTASGSNTATATRSTTAAPLDKAEIAHSGPLNSSPKPLPIGYCVHWVRLDAPRPAAAAVCGLCSASLAGCSHSYQTTSAQCDAKSATLCPACFALRAVDEWQANRLYACNFHP